MTEIRVELEQVGSLLTPEQAAVVVAVGIAVFAVLGWRFVRRWKAPRSN